MVCFETFFGKFAFLYLLNWISCYTWLKNFYIKQKTKHQFRKVNLWDVTRKRVKGSSAHGKDFANWDYSCLWTYNKSIIFLVLILHWNIILKERRCFYSISKESPISHCWFFKICSPKSLYLFIFFNHWLYKTLSSHFISYFYFLYKEVDLTSIIDIYLVLSIYKMKKKKNSLCRLLTIFLHSKFMW